MTILGALDVFYLFRAYSLLEDVFPMDPCMVNKENRPFCRSKKGPDCYVPPRCTYAWVSLIVA